MLAPIPEKSPTHFDPSLSPALHTSASQDGEYCHVCKQSFGSQYAYNRHWLGCKAPTTKGDNPSQPKQARGASYSYEVVKEKEMVRQEKINVHFQPERTPTMRTSASGDAEYCDICEQTFGSRFQFDRHWLSCQPPAVKESSPTLSSAPAEEGAKQDEKLKKWKANMKQAMAGMMKMEALEHRIDKNHQEREQDELIDLDLALMPSGQGNVSSLSVADASKPVPAAQSALSVEESLLVAADATETAVASPTEGKAAPKSLAEAAKPIPATRSDSTVKDPLPIAPDSTEAATANHLKGRAAAKSLVEASKPIQLAVTKAQNTPKPAASRSIKCGVAHCGKSFTSETSLDHHKIDLHKHGAIPTVRLPSHQPAVMKTQNTPKSASLKSFKCGVGGCQKAFTSEAAVKNHKIDSHDTIPVVRLPSHQPTVTKAQNTPNPSAVKNTPVPAAVKNRPNPGAIKCDVAHCGMSFRSEAALNVHKIDAHAIGGRGLDIHGKDAWMLPQATRQVLAQAGALKSSSGGGPSSPRGRGKTSGKKTSARGRMPTTPAGLSGQKQLPHPLASTIVVPMPLVGGPEDRLQGEEVREKIMRLLLQEDVKIHNNGKITCCGINWTRIGVAKQYDVVGMFSKLCYLPEALQYSEYVPAPTTFKDEYTADYPVGDFKLSPEHFNTRPALGAVALSCSRVLLANGLQEVVKVAAIDVVSCRILMNYLVCTDPKALVHDWRTKNTGMSSWVDVEAARQAGYKVFKGWEAARAALWKYIDKQTIIVGYNLRADLDALRMIHGRSVDVIKLIEKAADGPLTKQQVSLESLCRDLLITHLITHPTFGRQRQKMGKDEITRLPAGHWRHRLIVHKILPPFRNELYQVIKNVNEMRSRAERKYPGYQKCKVC
ncbi:hypothetical protein BCR34DRAFT_563910 [Clohesyomyces aquaticus]|uniref:C2H2-type domain-containing protein n=1 Tax=Clohesyomyces aquaticus TaxID=1231657 RepID=A0A1Y1ZPZ6_9PLEO|nr:hypothetical protein BCR34DRAFT_563910 [Clohesyomyces aquaticus]